MTFLTKKNLDLAIHGFKTEYDTFSPKEVSDILTFLEGNEEKYYIARNVRHSDGRSEPWRKDYFLSREKILNGEFPHFSTWATYASNAAMIQHCGRRVAEITKRLLR